jgi:hypothetical protein
MNKWLLLALGALALALYYRSRVGAGARVTIPAMTGNAGSPEVAVATMAEAGSQTYADAQAKATGALPAKPAPGTTIAGIAPTYSMPTAIDPGPQLATKFRYNYRTGKWQ